MADEKAPTSPDTEVVEDDRELLGEVESNPNQPDYKADEDDEDEDEEEKPEPSDDDDDLEDEEDEDKKPEIPFDRPTIKDLKTKYPELFKDFPALKDAYFREIEFTRLFPTVEDAREAFDDNEAYANLREAALQGNPDPVFEAVEKSDKAALEKFTLNLLPALYKRDSRLYSDAVTPVFENMVRYAFNTGVSRQDEDLKNAALQISLLLFDSSEVAEGKRSVAKRLPEEKPEDKQRKTQEAATQYARMFDGVSEQISTSLKAIIRKDFDPENVFTPFMRKQLIDTVINKVARRLQMDKGHMTVMEARWKRAKANGYTNDETSKIVSAYLARAKSLIPSVSDAVRTAALGTSKKAAEHKRRGAEQSAPPRRESTGGRPPSRESKSDKIDYRKLSDLDILNSE